MTPTSVVLRVFAAAAICVIGGFPGIILGGSIFNAGGVWAGVAVWFVAYSAFLLSARFDRVRRSPHLWRALLVGYITRAAVVAAVPFGWILEMIIAFPSLSIAAMVVRRDPALDPDLDDPTFAFAFAGTLVHGLVLHVLLAVYVGVVYLLLRRFWKPKAKGICRTCGYDLRATAERCPECGAPVPADHVPTVVSGSATEE